jgi:RimJ/RimL family protein N-acetyltransferase
VTAAPAYEYALIGDGRVTLRPWRVEDAPLMTEAADDREIARFCMMPDGYTTALARDFITDAPRAWAEDGWLHLALTEGGRDEPVGALGVLKVDRNVGSAELGYWVMLQHRSRGLARAAVRLATEWSFATLGLRRLAIGTLVANDASRRIARSLGFRPEALLRSYRPFGDRRSDCIAYSLLHDEWELRRAAPAGARPAAGGCTPAPLEPDDVLLPALAARRTDYPAASPSLPPEPPPLGDEHIVLRPYTDDDLADLVAACNDPDTQRWLAVLPTPYTEKDGREFLATANAGWGKDNDAYYCIADLATNRLLGGIGLHGREFWAGVAEIGYHVAPWARRRGVAVAAARLVARWGLDVLGLGRVQILADTRNAGSCRVAEQLGFTHEGVRRADHGREGDVGDHAIFSLLPGDPQPW